LPPSQNCDQYTDSMAGLCTSKCKKYLTNVSFVYSISHSACRADSPVTEAVMALKKTALSCL